jgi:hypothetical protein
MRGFAALLSTFLALAACLGSSEAIAASRVFKPSADTYVNSSSPKKKFGSASRVVVRGSSGQVKETYARFTINNLTGTVTGARLRFYVTDATGNGPAVYKISTSWSEHKVTWKTRPHTLAGPNDNKGAIRGGAWVSWDVTPWVKGTGTYAFALKGGSDNRAAFMSREGSNDPQLVVTTSDPPPLSSDSLAFRAPTDTTTVSDITPVIVTAPSNVDWIGVYACGGWSAGEDTVRDPDGGFSIQWDTTMQGCSNGSQPLDVYAFTVDGFQLGEAHETVNIQNEALPPPPPPSSDCTASSEPEPIAGQGYTEVFGDCFDFLDRSVWCSHQWWEPNPPVGTQFADSSGVLHLQRRKADGYPNTTLSSEPCGQANPKSFQGGYMEARLKFTGVPGSGPAFWLFSTRHATNPAWPNVSSYCADHSLPTAQCYSAELDVFEGYGNHLDVFTGTLHRNSCNCYGVNDSQSSNNWQPQAAGTNLSSHWHVYAVKWGTSEVSWYLDGRLVMSAPLYDSTAQPMHLLFYNWDTPWEAGNDTSADSPDVIETQVDWVRVWQE